MSLPTPPGPLKSSKFIIGGVKNRRPLDQVFLDLKCPSWHPSGSIFSELGHTSSMRTGKKHGKNTWKYRSNNSVIWWKNIQMGWVIHREKVLFWAPTTILEKKTFFVFPKSVKMDPKWLPKHNEIPLVWGGGDETPHGVFDKKWGTNQMVYGESTWGKTQLSVCIRWKL